MNKNLKVKLWDQKAYYNRIGTIDDLSHPGILEAQRYCENANSILDYGCGDGRKLELLGNKETFRVGVDVGKAGIEIAKEKYPKSQYKLVQGLPLDFETDFFERIVSFFVFEHVDSPVSILKELQRVLKTGGLLIILCPNFGSPNRCSPNYHGNRLVKLLKGFVSDIFTNNYLNWNTVVPRDVSMEEFDRDFDTTVEPYLGSLVSYLKNNNFEIVQTNSYWELELEKASLIQKIFRFFATLKIYPFTFWGPHLFVVAKKK